jgi:hypothetical protein
MRKLLVVFALISLVTASITPYAARAETPTASSQPTATTTKGTKDKKAKKPAPPTHGPTASPTPSSEPRDYRY